jgi:hypothetical protein
MQFKYFLSSCKFFYKAKKYNTRKLKLHLFSTAVKLNILPTKREQKLKFLKTLFQGEYLDPKGLTGWEMVNLDHEVNNESCFSASIQDALHMQQIKQEIYANFGGKNGHFEDQDLNVTVILEILLREKGCKLDLSSKDTVQLLVWMMQ